jgi:hypothetical protein
MVTVMYMYHLKPWLLFMLPNKLKMNSNMLCNYLSIVKRMFFFLRYSLSIKVRGDVFFLRYSLSIKVRGDVFFLKILP